MGILKLRFVIYILMAVLAVQKLSNEANITSSSNKLSTNELETNNLVDANNTAKPVLTKVKATDALVIPKPNQPSVTKEAMPERLPSPIALPESLVIQEIAPEASKTLRFSSIQLEQDAQKQKAVEPTVVNPTPQPKISAVLETEVVSTEILAQEDGSTPMVHPTAPPQALATSLEAVSSHSTEDLQGVPTFEQSTMPPSADNSPREVVGQATPPQSNPETEARYFDKSFTEPLSAGSAASLPLTSKVPETTEWTTSASSLEVELSNGSTASPPATSKVPETTEWTTSASSLEVEILQETSLPSVAQRQTPQVAQATPLVAIQSDSDRDLQGVVPLNQNATVFENPSTSTPKEAVNSQPSQDVVAQATPTQSRPEVERLQNELRTLEETQTKSEFQSSPALSIVIPTGFGADNNTAFISATYQSRTRDVSDLDDGGIGVGIGLGDARKSVGVELSYAAASFGNSRNFGSGGFNVKVHRLVRDDLAVAVGWNGFLNVGDRNDFEQSFYGVATKIFRTRDDINLPFSRVAVTAGIGNGQFETENSVARGDNNVNVFGNVALRVAQPVSLIAEWSGQDLGVGLSIAPFKNFPLVITPAVRDLVGAGDEPRFVLSTGFAFRF